MNNVFINSFGINNKMGWCVTTTAITCKLSRSVSILPKSFTIGINLILWKNETDELKMFVRFVFDGNLYFILLNTAFFCNTLVAKYYIKCITLRLTISYESDIHDKPKQKNLYKFWNFLKDSSVKKFIIWFNPISHRVGWIPPPIVEFFNSSK